MKTIKLRNISLFTATCCHNAPAVYKGTCGWRSCPQCGFCFGLVWCERQVFHPDPSPPPGSPGPPRPPSEHAGLRNEPACEPDTQIHTFRQHSLYTFPEVHVNRGRHYVSCTNPNSNLNLSFYKAHIWSHLHVDCSSTCDATLSTTGNPTFNQTFTHDDCAATQSMLEGSGIGITCLQLLLSGV